MIRLFWRMFVAYRRARILSSIWKLGAWNFVKGRLYEALGDEYTIRRVSRFESGSPAAGSHGVHVQEQEEIVEDAVVNGL